jgi:TetR/AcrR family transcriptional regulator, tetracycline repressor protein
MDQGRDRRGPGHRAGLRPEVVIAAARSLCEREGLAAVTMRRLAGDLGVAPNALYSHFADKTALLDAVLDDVIGEIEPPDPQSVGWAEGLVALMGQTRRLLLDHAELIPLFLSRPRRGPNAIRLGEVTLQLLARGGIQGEPAVRALRALLVYSFGFAALQAPWRTEPQPDQRRARSQAALAAAPQEFPNVARLAAPLGRQPTDEDFQAGLRWLLAGIAERA